MREHCYTFINQGYNVIRGVGTPGVLVGFVTNIWNPNESTTNLDKEKFDKVYRDLREFLVSIQMYNKTVALHTGIMEMKNDSRYQ